MTALRWTFGVKFSMKKMFFVMNPYAGMRKANRYLADILEKFNRAGYEVTTYMTAGPGDGQKAVAAHAKDTDLVVCVGGDGTFNETVNGVLSSGVDVPVGYIPAGSTNDFASSLKLSSNYVQAAEDIISGEPVAYDVGKFGDRYFSYVASFGAFTKASYKTPQNVKNALGHTAYILEGLPELSLGGILTLDPRQVDMRDGKFELLLVRAPRDLVEMGDCIRALQSQKYNCGMITFLSTPRLRVIADPEMPWTLDGEREDGHGVVEVENLYKAIRLMQRKA